MVMYKFGCKKNKSYYPLKIFYNMRKKNIIKIPLRLNAIGHLETDVKIDKIKTSFIVDTGASNTVVDIDFAKENLLEFAAIEMQGGGVGTSEMVLFHKQVDVFKINDFKIPAFDLYATDFQHVKDSLAKKGITEPCHGVIGADILIKYKAKINYKKKKLYLRK